MKIQPLLLIIPFIFFVCSATNAQPITGVWKGKIDRKTVELKIIKNGDSLTGTSYYYESANAYRRYSIKGYFDDRDNSVVWWDDQLIEAKNSNRIFAAKSPIPYLSSADFNCPGGTKMYLTGKTVLKENEEVQRGPVDLEKMDTHTFNDEWDYVIENYTYGANDPELVDSIGKLARPNSSPLIIAGVDHARRKSLPPPIFLPPAASPTEEIKTAPVVEPIIEPVVEKVVTPTIETVVQKVPLNNEEKFFTRRRQVIQEIQISGDSLELTFYDNAEVDGDSIAIFLNDQLLYEHVRLSDKPYTLKLPVETLKQSNELVMVAENLGSIPPNTSLMVAMIDGRRYETRLESTEQSSAVIRFVRNKP
ncbi:MAG: hypothetical protein Q7T76_17505 [Ferruginibacter sp.]|nr:hypothetical protein [Ferruginibacter sp.]